MKTLIRYHKSVTYHEAGHAVIANLCGCDVEWVKIFHNYPKLIHGRCSYVLYGSEFEIATKEIYIGLAGFIAERLYSKFDRKRVFDLTAFMMTCVMRKDSGLLECSVVRSPI